MTIPERHNPPEGPSSCPDTSANPISHNPTLGNSWHTSFDPPFNDECDDLNNLHKKDFLSKMTIFYKNSADDQPIRKM